MKVNFSKTKPTLLSDKGFVFVLMEKFLKYFFAFLVNHVTLDQKRVHYAITRLTLMALMPLRAVEIYGAIFSHFKQPRIISLVLLSSCEFYFFPAVVIVPL